MSDFKRKSDVLRNDSIVDSDLDCNDDDLINKSPKPEDGYKLCKRRKIDLCSEIFDLGYTGTKEELDKMSKKQAKKLMRKLKWLKMRPQIRQREKEKKKLKMIEKRLSGFKISGRKAKKLNTMANSERKLSVVIDLSFDDLMIDKDLCKCIKQINRCYCANRSVKNPLQFYVTNLDGRSKQILSKYDGYRNWDVKFSATSYMDLFEKDRLVYLTSDSDNVISQLDEKKVYIIGGLVDHNYHKNICYRVACDQGIAHGCLPLDKYLEMKTRKVLAINHVFEIMLHVAGGVSWKDAFLKVLPQRKNAVPKEDDDSKMEDNVVNETGGGD